MRLRLATVEEATSSSTTYTSIAVGHDTTGSALGGNFTLVYHGASVTLAFNADAAAMGKALIATGRFSDTNMIVTDEDGHTDGKHGMNGRRWIIRLDQVGEHPLHQFTGTSALTVADVPGGLLTISTAGDVFEPPPGYLIDFQHLFKTNTREVTSNSAQNTGARNYLYLQGGTRGYREYPINVGFDSHTLTGEYKVLTYREPYGTRNDLTLDQDWSSGATVEPATFSHCKVMQEAFTGDDGVPEPKQLLPRYACKLNPTGVDSFTISPSDGTKPPNDTFKLLPGWNEMFRFGTWFEIGSGGSGKFRFKYDGTTIPDIEWNITATALRTKLLTILGPSGNNKIQDCNVTRVDGATDYGFYYGYVWTVQVRRTTPNAALSVPASDFDNTNGGTDGLACVGDSTKFAVALKIEVYTITVGADSKVGGTFTVTLTTDGVSATTSALAAGLFGDSSTPGISHGDLRIALAGTSTSLTNQDFAIWKTAGSDTAETGKNGSAYRIVLRGATTTITGVNGTAMTGVDPIITLRHVEPNDFEALEFTIGSGTLPATIVANDIQTKVQNKLTEQLRTLTVTTDVSDHFKVRTKDIRTIPAAPGTEDRHFRMYMHGAQGDGTSIEIDLGNTETSYSAIGLAALIEDQIRDELNGLMGSASIDASGVDTTFTPSSGVADRYQVKVRAVLTGLTIDIYQTSSSPWAASTVHTHDVAAGDTSITIQHATSDKKITPNNGAGLPEYCFINSEIVKVTSVADNSATPPRCVLTVERGQFGTTPAVHYTGDNVVVLPFFVFNFDVESIRADTLNAIGLNTARDASTSSTPNYVRSTATVDHGGSGYPGFRITADMSGVPYWISGAVDLTAGTDIPVDAVTEEINSKLLTIDGTGSNIFGETGGDTEFTFEAGEDDDGKYVFKMEGVNSGTIHEASGKTDGYKKTTGVGLSYDLLFEKDSSIPTTTLATMLKFPLTTGTRVSSTVSSGAPALLTASEKHAGDSQYTFTASVTDDKKLRYTMQDNRTGITNTDFKMFFDSAEAQDLHKLPTQTRSDGENPATITGSGSSISKGTRAANNIKKDGLKQINLYFEYETTDERH